MSSNCSKKVAEQQKEATQSGSHSVTPKELRISIVKSGASKCPNVADEQDRQAAHSVTPKGLGISIDKPKFSQYAQIEKRLQSFERNWPSTCPVSVHDLVEAGLVYTGVGDSVRCYFCGGGLRNWETGDDPMVEHARWYPDCGHLLTVKGQRFIDSVTNGQPLEEPSGISKAFRNREEDVMKTAACQALVQMGYTEEDINLAVKIFKHNNKGCLEFTGTHLCEILMGLEDKPDEKQRYIMTFTCEKPVNLADPAGDISTTVADEDEDEIKKMKEENARLKESQICKICLDNFADIVFLPCGHMVSCGQCAPILTKCRICRNTVNGFVKAVFATCTFTPG